MLQKNDGIDRFETSISSESGKSALVVTDTNLLGRENDERGRYFSALSDACDKKQSH